MNDNQNKTIESAISVGDFLGKYNVCIPILQRDYAQGRDGKEYIREVFLKDIKDAVEKNQPLTMDFVYGYQEHKKEYDKEYDVFYPLDGQQRLTTVWLVYWYLALRACKLNSEISGLSRFTYQTRKSSREFCEALCKRENNIYYKENNGLVDYIKNQRWFFSAWKNDPTINAMLRMLGGTNGKDGIEPVFSGMAKQPRKWEQWLIQFKQCITFCVLDIGNDKLPRESADRLYVKMNARGKALTDFENFKADLVGEIEKKPNDSLDSYIKEIPQKLDNSWNDIFWESANAGDLDGQTDEIFFAFINRFCFNRLCVVKGKHSEGEEEYLLKADLIKIIDKIFDGSLSESEKSKKAAAITEEQKATLSSYSFFNDDDKIKYTKFEYYQSILDFDGLQALSTILDRVKNRIGAINDQLDKINKVVSKREESKYRFLPTYQTNEGKKQITKDDNGNKVGIVEKTTQKERVYFFAICKYFETIESFEKDTFIDWMRFCRNVIENAGVYSVAAMVSAMRKIDDFDPKDILTALSEMQIGLAESTKIAKQIQEEIQKAKKIKSENKDWKQQIIEAEDTLFLCGKIGFLFWDDKGQENWDSFKTKLANLKEFFGKDEASIDFVRRYALSFEDFWYVSGRLIFHNKGWQRRGDSWLDVLSEDDLERVHKILMCEEYNNAKGPYKEFVNSKSFEKAVLKEGVFEGKKDLRIAWYNNSYALYKKSAQNDKLCFDYSSDEYPEYLLLRNSLLSKLREVDGFSLGSDQIIVEDESYYYGDDVFLEYNNINYIWSSNDCIYTFDIDKGTKSKKNILEKASKINAYGIIDNLKTYNYS